MMLTMLNARVGVLIALIFLTADVCLGNRDTYEFCPPIPISSDVSVVQQEVAFWHEDGIEVLLLSYIIPENERGSIILDLPFRASVRALDSSAVEGRRVFPGIDVLETALAQKPSDFFFKQGECASLYLRLPIKARTVDVRYVDSSKSASTLLNEGLIQPDQEKEIVQSILAGGASLMFHFEGVHGTSSPITTGAATYNCIRTQPIMLKFETDIPVFPIVNTNVESLVDCYTWSSFPEACPEYRLFSPLVTDFVFFDSLSEKKELREFSALVEANYDMDRLFYRQLREGECDIFKAAFGDVNCSGRYPVHMQALIEANSGEAWRRLRRLDLMSPLEKKKFVRANLIDPLGVAICETQILGFRPEMRQAIQEHIDGLRNDPDIATIYYGIFDYFFVRPEKEDIDLLFFYLNDDDTRVRKASQSALMGIFSGEDSFGFPAWYNGTFRERIRGIPESHQTEELRDWLREHPR